MLAPALIGKLADLLRLSHRQATALLGVIEIFLGRISAAERPFGPLPNELAELLDRQVGDRAMRADSGWNGLEERVSQPVHLGHYLVITEICARKPHSAVDVVADATRRNHTIALVDGCHTADRKAP